MAVIEEQARGTTLRQLLCSQARCSSPDAVTRGDGGQIVVWADGFTRYAGEASARGGGNGGNGGLIEVSGKESLRFVGTVDLRAPQGETGTLLLDPKFIVIQAGGADPATGQTFAANPAGTATISGATLGTAINSANIVLQANTDATFNDNVTATTSGNGLSVQAGRSIIFNANRVLTLNGGNFTGVINDITAQLANRDPGPAQFVMNSGSQIQTNGGANSTVQVFGLGSGGEIFIGNGGAATINAGSGQILLTGVGRSGAADAYGIVINGGSVVQGGGILLSGTGGNGTHDNYGICLEDPGTLVKAASITMFGLGQGTGDSNYGIAIQNGAKVSNGALAANFNLSGTGSATGVNNNIGVLMRDPGTEVSAGSGSMTIFGTGLGSGSNNVGVVLLNGATVTSPNGSAAINLVGKGAGTAPGIATFKDGTPGAVNNVIGGPTTLGDIDLRAETTPGSDAIVLSDLTVQSTGSLTLRPRNLSSSVGVGGASGDFNLSTAELALFQPGFSEITIGAQGGTGPLTVNALTRPESLTFLADGSGGPITVTGPVSVTDPAAFGLNLTAGRNIVMSSGASLTTAGTPINLVAFGNTPAPDNFVGISVNGAINSAGGDIFILGTGGGGTTLGNRGVDILGVGAGVNSGAGSVTIQGTGGAGGVTAQLGFSVLPGIPCSPCTPTANINAGAVGTITIGSTP